MSTIRGYAFYGRAGSGFDITRTSEAVNASKVVRARCDLSPRPGFTLVRSSFGSRCEKHTIDRAGAVRVATLTSRCAERGHVIAHRTVAHRPHGP